MKLKLYIGLVSLFLTASLLLNFYLYIFENRKWQSLYEDASAKLDAAEDEFHQKELESTNTFNRLRRRNRILFRRYRKYRNLYNRVPGSMKLEAEKKKITRLIMIDGSILTGSIVSENETTLKLNTGAEVINIPLEDIRRREEKSQ